MTGQVQRSWNVQVRGDRESQILTQNLKTEVVMFSDWRCWGGWDACFSLEMKMGHAWGPCIGEAETLLQPGGPVGGQSGLGD